MLPRMQGQAARTALLDHGADAHGCRAAVAPRDSDAQEGELHPRHHDEGEGGADRRQWADVLLPDDYCCSRTHAGRKEAGAEGRSEFISLLSDFLVSKAAPGLVQTLSGHTLEQIAHSAGMTMKMLAATVRKAGTEAGLGGTEMGIAVSEMFKVHIFYWQPLRGNEFKLINLQRTTVQPLGLVHAEYIPVSCITACARIAIAHPTAKTSDLSCIAFRGATLHQATSTSLCQSVRCQWPHSHWACR